MDDILNLEMSVEIEALRKEIDALKKKNKNLTKVLIENDLDEEIQLEKPISPEEEICVKGIDQILELVRAKVFDAKDIQTYDILHKNLRMIRGHVDDTKKKAKKSTKADLLKIVGKNG